ncbi:MAG TPA: long-chain fatty acid--CoA ligase [Syntrophomonadaceae bacterium]|nr:long-chain fatty acid--CoA ligase [Syntrophomonadaceae bacterium]
MVKKIPEENFFLMDYFYEHTDTIPEMFYNVVEVFGDRPANMFKEGEIWKTISYKQWALIAEEIANALLSLGIQAGDRNCIIAHTSPQWAWCDIGNIIAGGVTVTIFPTLIDNEVEYILNHSQVQYIFAGNPEIAANIEKLMHKTPSVKGLICMSGVYDGDGQKTWNLEQFRAMGRLYAFEHPGELEKRWQSVEADDAATIIYTSGTTGKLKPARFTQKGCVAAAWRGIRFNAEGGKFWNYNHTYFSVMPLAHVMERTYGYFCWMAIGGLIGYGSDPTNIISDMQAIKPNVMVWVPRLYERILRGIESVFCSTPEGKKLWDWAMDVGQRMVEVRTQPDGTIDMCVDPVDELSGQLKEDYIKAREMVYSKFHAALGGNLLALACGGANLNAEMHRKYLGMGYAMGNGWGMTETFSNLSLSPYNAIKVGWNGPPAPGVDLKVDEDGEALVKGTGIINNYHNDPESDVGSFTEDGYLRTGDIIEFDENGYLRIIDRKKSILVLDTGKNVAPARIEAKLLSNMAIEQAMIIGDGRKYISALIVPSWDTIIGMFKSRNIDFDESKLVYEEASGMKTCIQVGDDVANHPLVVEMVEEIINKVNQDLSDYETIKKYKILPNKFTESRGELTPTLKIKNQVVKEKYSDLIEALYN